MWNKDLHERIGRLEAQNVLILSKLDQLLKKEDFTMADFSQLQAEVARNTTVVSSVKALIAGFAAQLQAAGTDQAAINAVIAQMKANDDDLAAAVTANTPAAPTS